MAALALSMLFVLLIILGIIILYFINLQNTVKAAAPENRKIPPANVWLLLIPVFSTFYSFVVARKISETIQAEYASKGQAPESSRPTYAVGMTMAALGLINFLISLFYIPTYIEMYSGAISGDYENAVWVSQSMSGPLSTFSTLIGFAVFILWIVYWVQTSEYKNKMRVLPNNNVDEDSIFRV